MVLEFELIEHGLMIRSRARRVQVTLVPARMALSLVGEGDTPFVRPNLFDLHRDQSANSLLLDRVSHGGRHVRLDRLGGLVNHRCEILTDLRRVLVHLSSLLVVGSA